MKVNIADMKKAIAWVENNSRELQVNIYQEVGKVKVECFDRQDNHVQITLFEDGQMMPKIMKTEILK
jgi:hypothetical protein